MIKTDIFHSILKFSNYNLSFFSDKEIEALRQKVFIEEVRGKQTAYVNCAVHNKEIQLKPEEIIRQLYEDSVPY